MASRFLTELRSKNPQPFTEGLLDYYERLSPRHMRPTWLAPYAQALESATTTPTRLVFAAPPQHGKTEVTLHGLCRAVRVDPTKRHAYVTYSQTRANEVSDRCRILAEDDGIRVEGRKDGWDVPGGGHVKWTSIRGSFTGYTVDGLLIIDDPIKDHIQASSATYRQQLIDWYDTVAERRTHKTTAIIVMATRWNPDDLSGQLIRRGFQYVNLKAISDGENDPLERPAGEALCPELHDLAELDGIRRTNAYAWASLFQGEPRPRGGTIFRDPTYYTEIPQTYRVGYGVDLAYTSKTHADWSVCLELWREETDDPKRPVFYVVEIDRKQVDAPSFTLTLKARQSTRRGPILWYAAGAEKGVGDFIRSKIPSLTVRNATADKFVRAQGVAEAWNDGRVFVPKSDPSWLAAFLDEVLNFTGVNDAHDDQVDALAAAYDVLRRKPADLTVGGARSTRGSWR